VTIAIDQDVSVVSVLDLQQEGDYAVRGKRFDEIPLRFGESTRIGIPISLECEKCVSFISDTDYARVSKPT
jgi:hypothetical protein